MTSPSCQTLSKPKVGALKDFYFSVQQNPFIEVCGPVYTVNRRQSIQNILHLEVVYLSV